MSLELLTSVSNRYGGDSAYVLGGGGNTSYKDGDEMYVKASGTTLAEITGEGFARMNLSALKEIMAREYPADPETRESRALGDLMAARMPGEDKRPSVETLLHAVLPYRFVVHTHPTLVNGVTCSREGAEVIADLFVGDALWVPVVNPGYILARTVNDLLADHRRKGGSDQMIFLENHGLFVQADTVEEIDAIYARVIAGLSAKVARRPLEKLDLPQSPTAGELLGRLGDGEGLHAEAGVNDDLLGSIGSREAFAPLEFSMTPDHIVYCGFKPLFLDGIEEADSAFRSFEAEYGAPPKVIVLKDAGFYALGESAKAARLCRELFFDDLKIAVYTESFGGHSFMPADKIDFIRNWEAEQYRSQISRGEEE